MEKNAPRLRFPGFTDAWEQRKLGDCFEERTERRKNEQVELLSVTISNGVIKQSESDKRNIASFDTSNYKMVFPGDVAYNSMRMWQGAEGVSKYVGIVSPAYTVIHPKTGFDGAFFAYLFKRERMLKIFERNSQGLTSDTWNLKYPALSRITISAPSIEEQQSIVEILNELDNLITLHQRKCDEIKNLKKCMLQKMFPKEGEQIPEIRFPGFTEAWVQHKCRDIFDKVGVPVEVEKDKVYKEIGIRSHGKGIFYKDEVSGKELGNKRVFWIEPGCFVVNIVFAWERAVARTSEHEIGMIASHRFPMYRPKEGLLDLDFITKFFITDKGKEILELASPGGAGRNKTLGQKEFAESRIMLPSYEEQKKIGTLIDELDRTITLHQRKLDQMKELKKSLLQQMFI